MITTIRVRSTRRDDARAVLNDENAAHPNGHVLIIGDGKVHAVGDVPRVRELLNAGLLELVESKEPKEKKADGPGSPS